MPKKIVEERKDNVIIIAGKDFSVYNQVILDKFQKYDQIEISVADNYVERALYIINQWQALGISPLNGYPIKFEKKQEDIVNKQNRTSHVGIVNRIILTKHPELYRFTK